MSEANAPLSYPYVQVRHSFSPLARAFTYKCDCDGEKESQVDLEGQETTRNDDHHNGVNIRGECPIIVSHHTRGDDTLSPPSCVHLPTNVTATERRRNRSTSRAKRRRGMTATTTGSMSEANAPSSYPTIRVGMTLFLPPCARIYLQMQPR